MIARLWRGWTSPANADAYERLLVDTVLPALRKIDGYHGGYVLRRESGDEVEFAVLNLFVSLDAVKRFAGEEYEVPVLEPEARQLLARMNHSRGTTRSGLKSEAIDDQVSAMPGRHRPNSSQRSERHPPLDLMRWQRAFRQSDRPSSRRQQSLGNGSSRAEPTKERGIRNPQRLDPAHASSQIDHTPRIAVGRHSACASRMEHRADVPLEPRSQRDLFRTRLVFSRNAIQDVREGRRAQQRRRQLDAVTQGIEVSRRSEVRVADVERCLGVLRPSA